MTSLANSKSFNKGLSVNSGSAKGLNPQKFFLRINKGSDQGTVFQLKSNEILIGRDPSNHIELKDDPKISRKHVRVAYNNGKYIIQDITKNNFISVNGIKLKQTELKNNSIIQVGDHTLQFITSTRTTPQSQQTKSSTSQTNPLRLILLLIIIAGGGLYFFLDQPKVEQATNYKPIENEDIVERRIEDIDETIEKLDTQIKSSNKFDGVGRSAQSIYLEGKRDFDRGKYSYAISAFRAVLALNPDHGEARRYLRLASQYFSDIIESQFRNGLTDRETGRYTECKGAMENIMNLINDPTSPRYKEAQKVYLECDLKEISGGL